MSDNIFWSVSMEGNGLDREQVRSIIHRAMGPEGIFPVSRDEKEVCNHILLYTGDRLPYLAESSISGLHERMMDGINRFPDAGDYRRCQMAMVFRNGNESFIPCPQENIIEEMGNLNDWAYDSETDIVSTAAMYFHEFESIQPYSDGNGRLGRIILHQMLG